MTFKTGDKVHITEAYEDWYWRKMKDVPFIYPETPLVVIRVERDKVWVRRDSKRQEPICYAPPEYLTKDTDDHTAAVIEAARKLRRKYVHMEIVANRETGETWLDVIVTTAFKTYLSATFPESTDPLPDTFVADLTELCIAIDAYDEAETENDILTTESEG